jgi:hypothetical protein
MVCPILRHPQPQCANPDDQRTGVIAAAVRQPGLALALGVANLFGHLRRERRLDQRLDCATLTWRDQSFEVDDSPFTGGGSAERLSTGGVMACW